MFDHTHYQQLNDALALLARLRHDIIEEQKMRGLYAAWMSKWTNHCPMCDASGVINWTENGAPHGEGYWPMPMSEPCENCTGAGICPRCGWTAGEEYFAEGEHPCPNCGWNWGKNPDDLRPNNGFEADYWDHLFDKIAQVIRGE